LDGGSDGDLNENDETTWNPSGVTADQAAEAIEGSINNRSPQNEKWCGLQKRLVDRGRIDMEEE
jgi:hypothetical protein